MSPILGQGLNSGMEDVAVFAQCLEQQQGNVDTALLAYNKARLPDIQAIMTINEVVASFDVGLASQVQPACLSCLPLLDWLAFLASPLLPSRPCLVAWSALSSSCLLYSLCLPSCMPSNNPKTPPQYRFSCFVIVNWTFLSYYRCFGSEKSCL